MTTAHRTNIVLMADDDADDRLLVKDAMFECKAGVDMRFVANGEELMDYLLRRHQYGDPAKSPRPKLILLDLNMPKKNGCEAVEEIKKNCDLREIPVVIFTTSNAQTDIRRTYDLGVNSFVCKPTSFDALVDKMRVLSVYWLDVVQLP
jgi:two-component system, response regulator